MRYLILIGVWAGEIILAAVLAIIWIAEGGVVAFLLTAVAFWSWHKSGGSWAWTPQGVRSFLRNAKHYGF